MGSIYWEYTGGLTACRSQEALRGMYWWHYQDQEALPYRNCRNRDRAHVGVFTVHGLQEKFPSMYRRLYCMQIMGIDTVHTRHYCTQIVGCITVYGRHYYIVCKRQNHMQSAGGVRERQNHTWSMGGTRRTQCMGGRAEEV